MTELMKTLEGWEHFSHGADVGIRGRGRTVERAFAFAAQALTAIVTNPANVKSLQQVEVICAAENPDRLFYDYLFYDWINSVVFEMDTRKMVFAEFEVKIAEGKLYGLLRGEPLDGDRHEPAAEPKGATFTELRVYKSDEHWVAQCVVDV